MAEAAQQGDKLNVFISYSRDDLDFADQLRAALLGYDFTVTIDRESITSGEDWKKRLGLLIRDADTIVFVLSPSSARSSTCAWEATEAASLGKRILPILCRSLGDASPPPELAALQFIYFYDERKFPGSGFGTGLNKLRLALNADPGWLREHTRYLRLAKEWEEVGKPSDRRLLSAADIELAKTWISDRPERHRRQPLCNSISSRRARPRISAGKALRRSGCESWKRLSPAKREREERALLQESRALAIFAQQASNAGDRRRRCCWRWRRCPTQGLVACVRGLPARRPPCIRRGYGTAKPRWPGTAERSSPRRSAPTEPMWSLIRGGTVRVWDLGGERPSLPWPSKRMRERSASRRSMPTARMWSLRPDSTARVWDLRGEQRPSFVALEGHQGSAPSRRSAPTEPMWSRRRDNTAAGVGFARRAAELRRPRGASA